MSDKDNDINNDDDDNIDNDPVNSTPNYPDSTPYGGSGRNDNTTSEVENDQEQVEDIEPVSGEKASPVSNPVTDPVGDDSTDSGTDNVHHDPHQNNHGTGQYPSQGSYNDFNHHSQGPGHDPYGQQQFINHDSPYGAYNDGAGTYGSGAHQYGNYPQYEGYQDPNATVGTQEKRSYSSTDPIPKVNVFDALGFGFTATFKNPVLIGISAIFIVFTFAISIFIFAGSASLATESGTDILSATSVLGSMSFFGNILISVLGLIMTLIMTHASIKALTRTKMSMSDVFTDVRLLPGLLSYIGSQLVVFLGVFLSILVLMVPLAVIFLSSTGDPGMGVDVGIMVMLVVVSFLISLAASPFGIMAIYFAMDDQDALDAIGYGLRFGQRHYWALLGYVLLYSILSIIAIVVTLGLASFIVMPVGMVTQAHLYAQMTNHTLQENNVPRYVQQ